MKVSQLAISAILFSMPGFALAQNASPPPNVAFSSTPNGDVSPSAAAGSTPMAALGPPAIIWLRGGGAAVEDLGSAHGLEGWLAMKKDERGNNLFQVFYTTPDGEALVAGAMFDTHEVDITGKQLAATREGKSLQEGTAAPTQISSPNTGPTPTDSNPGSSINGTMSTSPAAPQAAEAPSTPSSPSVAQDLPPTSPTPPQASLGSATPATQAAAQLSDTDLSNFISPMGVNAADFSKLMMQLPRFRIGAANLPNLYMVADPHCPVCHKAWEELYPLIKNGQIAVTIILIHALPEDESPTIDAVDLLSNPNPALAWENGQGSTDNVKIDKPTSKAQEATGASYLKINDLFASQMQIAQTPTVFWVQNGQAIEGRALGSVLAFLQAVLKGGVAS